jgi:CheY-like chemotaxis protein
VDDDPLIRESLTRMFKSLGMTVITFAGAQQFLDHDREDLPGCLILDFQMPGQNGLELQTELSARHVDLPIIFLTAHGPEDRTDEFFSRLGDLFSKGIIVGGEVKVNTNFFCMPGEHHVGAIWKHIDLTDLSASPAPVPSYPGYPYPPAPPGVPSKPDSYTVYYGFDQYLRVLPGQRPGLGPKKRPRGWGLFGRASVSDGNPTPYRYFLSAGIGGDSPLGCHRGDTFGVGWTDFVST